AQGSVFGGDVDLSRNLARELPPRPLDANGAVGDIDGDRLGNGDGHLADTGHTRAAPPSLPDVGQDFAAHLESACPGTTHDALRRRQDGRSQTAEHARDSRRSSIDAKPGLADALDAHQNGVASAPIGRIAKMNAQDLVDAFAAFFERVDVALVAK